MQKRYDFVRISQTTYYHSKKNVCWIIHASKTLGTMDFTGMDEEKAIDYICTSYPYNVIGDLCMGRGLVGWYANEAGRNFVGTELNKKGWQYCLMELKQASINITNKWEE